MPALATTADNTTAQDAPSLVQQHYANHVASYSTAEMGGRTVERLVWRQPGVSYSYVQYIALGGVLFVSGDLGDAVYETGAESLAWWTRCDIHYFAGKCMASEEGRGYRVWDERACLRRLNEEIARMEADGEDLNADAVAEARRYAAESKHEWIEWARESASELFGDDWWEFVPNFGVVISDRCELHLAGLKLAMEQLRAQEVAAASVVLAVDPASSEARADSWSSPTPTPDGPRG